MPTISVTIDGRSYRMACGAGEEAHLTGLAEDLGARVARMRADFGEIGDMRLQVMAALALADELAELRGRLSQAEAEAAELRAGVQDERRAQAEAVARAAAGLDAATERVVRLGGQLAGASPRPGRVQSGDVG